MPIDLRSRAGGATRPLDVDLDWQDTVLDALERRGRDVTERRAVIHELRRWDSLTPGRRRQLWGPPRTREQPAEAERAAERQMAETVRIARERRAQARQILAQQREGAA